VHNIGVKRNTYKRLPENLKRKTPLERPRQRQNRIIIDLKETGFRGTE
jgi:hypothetical protein